MTSLKELNLITKLLNKSASDKHDCEFQLKILLIMRKAFFEHLIKIHKQKLIGVSDKIDRKSL